MTQIAGYTEQEIKVVEMQVLKLFEEAKKIHVGYWTHGSIWLGNKSLILNIRKNKEELDFYGWEHGSFTANVMGSGLDIDLAGYVVEGVNMGNYRPMEVAFLRNSILFSFKKMENEELQEKKELQDRL